MDQDKKREKQQQRQKFSIIAPKSVLYQTIKYVLLILNIMIVTTTAIVTIIVCLLPSIINEKKRTIENVLSFIQTGNVIIANDLQSSELSINNDGHNSNQRILNDEQQKLSSEDIETIRHIRYIILGLSACIILNQTLAVYGLFREQTCHVLISCVIIGLIGQLSLFILPGAVFHLILLYLIVSIGYVIQLGHLNSITKQPPPVSTRTTSRASSVEPFGTNKGSCCCRCKGCMCGGPIPAIVTPINTNHRKCSMPVQSNQAATSANIPYYYGSLGRKSRETKQFLNQLQTMRPDPEIYGGPRILNRNNMTNQSFFKSNNKMHNQANLNLDNYLYGNLNRDVPNYGYVALERDNNSTMI